VLGYAELSWNSSEKQVQVGDKDIYQAPGGSSVPESLLLVSSW
jgi:hypothetical protein